MSELSSLAQDRSSGWRRGLYALADADAAERAGLNLLECARAMNASGVSVLQVRAKGRPCGLISEWLAALERERGKGSPLLVVNDRADLADLHGADGVHIGQSDLPLLEIRRHFPKLLCGVSTHNLSQLRHALEEGAPDYIAFGPVYSTTSKENAEPELGLAMLEESRNMIQKSGVPLVAIGGITEAQLPAVAERADLVAAISLLLPEPGVSRPYLAIERQCARLHRKILAL